MENNWNNEVISLLDKVRQNSIILSEYHRKRFFHFKSFTKYFDLPILIFSSFGASFSVGSQGYLNQDLISLTSCCIGLMISIITSIKLYLNIDSIMTNELKMSKAFYTLSIDIYKTLVLSSKDRGEDGVNYLNKKYSEYVKLVENSNLLKKRFKLDNLAHIDKSQLIESESDTSDYSPPDTPPRFLHTVQFPEPSNIIIDREIAV